VDLFRRWIGQLQPARPFVRRWTVSDLAHFVDDSDSVRSAAAGKKVFHEIGCVQCHRIDGEGGSVGPDLSGIGRRPPREVLESIVEPGKVIADAYASWLIQTAEGETLSGRIEQEDEHRLLLRLTGSLEPAREIRLRNVEARRRLESSNMPAGIIDVLTKDEVLDLLAYLRNNSASGAPAGQ
jgi:putative heme-binding domain-containing protein